MTMPMPELTPPRLVVGISGASGAIYGVRLLELLAETPVQTHLVVTRSARITLRHEVGLTLADLTDRADVVHPDTDVGATIASGSFRTMGMVIAPCSIKSMSAIATGVTSTLLARAADVVLKERRRLVLMVRETPLHRNHLRTMTELAELGAIIAPPVPAFYTNPDTIDDIVNHTVGRVLDLFEIETGAAARWTGLRDQTLLS
jgi:4-hydroxy-3-polyprenylbenzoate decarboxylase